MKTVFADFETYYDQQYSLRRMTPVEYILDPRFECIGCAIAEGDGPVAFLEPDELRRYLAGLDPSRTVMVAHNASFDMAIMAWCFGFVPRLMVDTMAMARALVYHKTGSVALASIAKHLGLQTKGDAIHKVVGMGRAAIKAAGLWPEYSAYATGDVEICRGAFKRWRGQFPKSEFQIMDAVIRAVVVPRFQLDQTVLAEHLNQIRADKAALLARTGMEDRSVLMSNERFAEALQSLGVDPPRKTSPTTGNETWAFAKSDTEFLELENHESPEVQALVSARLGLKSTLEETRTERFIAISHLSWPAGTDPGSAGQRWMPIPLRYSGAHTHRFSGDWGLNMQNLPARKGTKALRRSLAAPRGCKVVAVDASQIEARITAWLAGEQHLVTLFANNGDPYLDFAERIFGRKLNKKEHKVERFLGKTCILGLGYGMGHAKFQHTVNIQAADQGFELRVTEARAREIVYLYRDVYKNIKALWGQLNDLLPGLSREAILHPIGPVVLGFQSIILPNTMRIHYHNLRSQPDGWVYDFGREKKRIYGGKTLENIVQALARIVIMDAANRITARTGFYWANQVHDELVFVVPAGDAESLLAIAIEEMSRRPDWAPDLPLAAEGEIADNYGDLK